MSEAYGAVFSVSQLNTYVARALRADRLLQDLRLRGEVSGFSAYPRAWYFTLKDEGAKISCVMFRDAFGRAGFTPRNGDQVILHGAAGLYTQEGRFQFIADAIRPEGAGLLWQRFEALKEKLRAEGLFDEARKRPLPPRPRRIAVVTSQEGAVWHDIHRIAGQRDPGVALVLVPCRVQGADAAPTIVAGIRKAQALPEIDLLIVGRGGGSMEDLWCFNEEAVARAIAACPIPVISAVGHETDFTIADFTADRRAATPSNAAEIAVPDREDALAALEMIRERLNRAAEDSLQQRVLAVSALYRRLHLLAPDARLEQQRHRSGELKARLERAAQSALSAADSDLKLTRLRLDSAADAFLTAKAQRAARLGERLDALNPLKVLERGFALVMSGETPVTRAAQAPEHMKLRFADGTVPVRREEA